MSSIHQLIPKDKFDIQTAEQLMGLSFDQTKPIIPDLLEKSNSFIIYEVGPDLRE